MKELKPVDVTSTPEALRLAQEVARSGVPVMLKTDQEDLAVVSPAPKARRSRRRNKRVVDNSWLENIIGIATKEDFPDLPTDISSNVDKYLYGTSSTDK